MACAIVTTVGSASANSYCSIADGTSYHETHLYADDWTDSDDDSRCRALQMATRLLDAWFDWDGTAVDSTQALLWPRVGATTPAGYQQASDAIPTRIVQATAELARQLITSDRTTDSDTGTQGITSLTAGSVSLEFRAVASKPIPDAVMSMVAPYGRPRSRSGSGSLTLRRA